MAISKDEEILDKQMRRSVRSPSQGSILLASSSPAVSMESYKTDAIVYPDGSVRRLWTPGDPWDSTTRFGTEQEE